MTTASSTVEPTRTVFHPNPSAIRRAIERRSVATLATVSANGRPHAATVLYQCVDDALIVSTHRNSRKARNVADLGLAAVTIAVRRLPIGPPASIQFQSSATVLAKDDPEIIRLAAAGRLDRITAHGEMNLDGACFLRLALPTRLVTYALGMSLWRAIRSPLDAAGEVHLRTSRPSAPRLDMTGAHTKRPKHPPKRSTKPAHVLRIGEWPRTTCDNTRRAPRTPGRGAATTSKILTLRGHFSYGVRRGRAALRGRCGGSDVKGRFWRRSLPSYVVATRPLRLFNTLTREVLAFEPRNPPDVGMYSCGPTVYAYQHIGNMRAYVFADTLKRTLTRKGYSVRHVINITDVGHLTSDADEGDDKLELAARREQRTIWEIAEHYTLAFKNDLERLRVLPPDLWPKATSHVPQMIGFAEELDRSGWCYRLPSGLYFDTSRDEDYGKLARLDVEGQLEGARVETVEGKRNAADFAVWRTADPSEKRQMEWDSPWDTGAPGWHLECSVMAIEHLGRHFDIHTGGVDHIPIHHTNEIAQSEAFLADGEEWVGWWLHGEFINLKGAKISKSTGGGVLIDDLVDRGYHPVVYRYLLLQAHYRSQIEFSWEALDSARTGLRRLLERYASARTAPPVELGAAGHRHLDAFDAAVSDDLNTAKALAVVAAASRDESVADSELSALAREFDAVLAIGLTDLSPTDLDLKRADVEVSDADVDALMAERTAARIAKDFARSDDLRNQLAHLGVVVEDHPDGTSSWRWG